MNPNILKYLIFGLLGVGIVMGAVYYALYKHISNYTRKTLCTYQV